MGILAIVLVSALPPEHSRWQRDESAVPIRLVIAWHHSRLHDVTHTTSGDVICWSCARCLGR